MKYTYYTEPVYEGMNEFEFEYPRGWRWEFEITPISISLVEQVTFNVGKVWRPAVRYFILNFTKHFAIGYSHMYYDGDHRSISFGWLHFCWGS